jgi:hypothetical protein
MANTSSSSAEPLTLTYVVERIAPGTRVLRYVEISNTTPALVDIAVYPAGASYVHNKFSFAPGRAADSLSSWTTVAQSILHLAPGASVTDAVTINVPKRATAGEHYAVVWAEVSAPSPTESGVRLVNRVGVRMYVSVGKGGLPVAAFTVGSLAAGRLTNGSALVTAKVRNIGLAAIDISGTLTLSKGPAGLSAGPFPVTLGTMLAPDHSVLERMALGGQIPRGPWRADLALSSNGTRRNSIDTLTFPALALPGGKRSLATPLAASVVLVLIVLATGSSVVFSRRRQRLE